MTDPISASVLGRRVTLAMAGTILVLAAQPAVADGSDGSFLISFVAGDYAVVGRKPDGGAPYAGTATISEDRPQVVLERRIGGRTVRAIGRVEVPSPPGEGHVLRFRWNEGQAVTMTCLAAGDLENYARLTCLWGADGEPPQEPGLEAMFPTATWPARAVPEN
jgi:hypothetical protein